MAIRTLSEKRASAQMLERQMRNWEIARSQEVKSNKAETLPRPVRPFVSISRSVGLPGELLAGRLHDKLGWPVFNREILRTMAGDDACRAQIFEVLDERAESWLHTFMRGFLQPNFVGREAYFNRLVETVAALSRTAPGIFIGRGVDLILPKNVGLRVRLSAGRDYCANAYSKDHGITYETALRDIEAIEHDRVRFIKQNFHVLPEASDRFDLVINSERVSLDETIDLVLAVLTKRGITK